MSFIDLTGLLSDLLKDKGTEAFTKIISDAIYETGISRSQSFTVHKKVADKLIAISKINIMKEE